MITKPIEDQVESLSVNGNQHESQENYVYVPSHSAGMDAEISIKAAEQWELELLADPKVRKHTHQQQTSSSC